MLMTRYTLRRMTDHGVGVAAPMPVERSDVRETTFGFVMEVETGDGQIHSFRLTHHQAQRMVGQILPPTGMTCPNCGGTGENKNTPGTLCVRCGGSGQA